MFFHNYFTLKELESWVLWRDSEAGVSTQVQRLEDNYLYLKPDFSFGHLGSRFQAQPISDKVMYLYNYFNSLFNAGYHLSLSNPKAEW